MKRHCTLILSMYLFAAFNVSAYEWSGNAIIESRLFNHDPLQSIQSQNSLSLSFNPEFYTDWNNANQTLTIEPFVRWDEADKERSHFDFREFIFYSNHDDWEIKAGIGKVFWGVTESQHLVDIINQTDTIESLDGEEKLGQPMINYTSIQDWGNVDVFILPYFRTRIFPGIKGRLRTQAYVDNDNELYQSSKMNRHIDYAFRYSHTIDDWDFGLSHFYGTNREPEFSAGLDARGNPVLTPFYYLLRQTGIDVQLVRDDWLWKLEAVHKRSNGQKYNASTFGFEYTYVGILDTQADLGLISEYMYDSRDNLASSPFEDDALLAMRLSFNDTQSSEILFGLIIDLDKQEKLYTLEASTRLTDNWKLNVEARVFSNTQPTSLLSDLRKDDHLQIELQYYF